MSLSHEFIASCFLLFRVGFVFEHLGTTPLQLLWLIVLSPEIQATRPDSAASLWLCNRRPTSLINSVAAPACRCSELPSSGWKHDNNLNVLSSRTIYWIDRAIFIDLPVILHYFSFSPSYGNTFSQTALITSILEDEFGLQWPQHYSPSPSLTFSPPLPTSPPHPKSAIHHLTLPSSQPLIHLSLSTSCPSPSLVTCNCWLSFPVCACS